MTTISQLAKRFGLSRSTLLYYDSEGILRPSGRDGNGYRRYDKKDQRRLEQICLYRKAGLPLKDIAIILERENGGADGFLQKRLEDISADISKLQEQQTLVLAMLQQEPSSTLKAMDKKTWTDLLTASGFSEADMRAWHVAFEKNAPEKHQAFLEFLGLEAEEIETIRMFE